jgi:hypothetical protein
MIEHSGRPTAHCGIAFAEALQGLELVHDASFWGATGDDVIGPVVEEDDVELLVEIFDVELLVVDEVWELLIVLVGREDVGELDGGVDVVVVVVTEATDGRAARQVQTAWADAEAGRAVASPQEEITHPIAKFAML